MPIQADVSSYPKPDDRTVDQLTQQSIKTASDFTGLQKSKLELAIRQQDEFLRYMSSLPKDATIDDVKKWGMNLVKNKIVNPRQYAQFVTDLPPPTGDPLKDSQNLARYLQTIEQIAGDRASAMKWKYDQDINVDTGNQTVPGKLNLRTGIPRPTAEAFQKQLPIGTEYIDPNSKETRRVGPELPIIPEGTERVPGGFPNQYRPVNKLNQSVDVPLPQARPEIQPTKKIWGDKEGVEAGIYPKSSFDERFGLTKRAPGEAEAEVATGQQSGQALAGARQRAASYAQDIFPVTEALTAAKNLGTKGTGPGSETVNYLKSFILTNLPGIQENDPEFKNINDFDKLQKYLVQIAKTTGNTNTNDQLAASFAGNPNIKMSNAATQDVLASIYALRTLDLAKTKVWEKQNLPDSQYAKWAAKWDNDIDPRAFGIQWMNPDAIVKLDKSLKDKAREKFNNSVNMARELGLM